MNVFGAFYFQRTRKGVRCQVPTFFPRHHTWQAGYGCQHPLLVAPVLVVVMVMMMSNTVVTCMATPLMLNVRSDPGGLDASGYHLGFRETHRDKWCHLGLMPPAG